MRDMIHRPTPGPHVGRVRGQRPPQSRHLWWSTVLGGLAWVLCVVAIIAILSIFWR